MAGMVRGFKECLRVSIQHDLLGGHLHVQRKGFPWLMPDGKRKAFLSHKPLFRISLGQSR
jgi:hypothetical protein